MIITWMLAATLFAVFVGIAAHASERALRLLGRQARAPWMLALAATLCWPLLAPLAARVLAWPSSAVPAAASPVAMSAVRIVSGGLSAAPGFWSSRVDVTLLALWAAFSGLLLLRLAFSLRALSRIERGARQQLLEGVSVLVTEDIGPAVFGVRRPRMIVPRWLFDLEASLRSLVLLHEQEHCDARDPQLTVATAVAVALMPWNACAWWMARRLRLALELDCDARVIRAVPDPRRYGKLLLFIGQRQSQTSLAAMLAESNSHLSRRITAMNSPRPNKPVARVAVFATVAIAALAFACSPRIGTDLTAPSPAAGAAPTRTSAKPATVAPGAVLRDFQVEKQVMIASASTTPRYPSILKTAGVEGEVMVSFVVDTAGMADPTTLKVLKSTHELFVQAVSRALPDMRFLPAQVGGRSVKQLVELPFVFQIAGDRGGSAERSSAGQIREMPPATSATSNTVRRIGTVIITAVPGDPKPPR